MATPSTSFSAAPAASSRAGAEPGGGGVSTPLALRVLRWRCSLERSAARALGLSRTTYVEQRVGEYRAYWEGAARSLGGSLVPLTEDIWEVRVQGRSIRLSAHVAPFDDPVTLRMAGDKPLCLRMAREEGVPVPEHLVFTLRELPLAEEFLRRAPGPCVVKPARGSASGMGITTHVRSPAGARRAAVLASLFGERLLIEHMVSGESYRLLFLDGRLLHAVRRTGARVVGDGRSTVRELIREAGGAGVDGTVRGMLAAQRLEPESVPSTGRPVVVRPVAAPAAGARELRTVYDTSVTELICSDVAGAAGRVVRRLGSRFAGVDLVTCDPSIGLGESGGAFLELNTTPGIHHHYQTEDERRTHPVAVRVLRALLSTPDEQGRARSAPDAPRATAPREGEGSDDEPA